VTRCGVARADVHASMFKPVHDEWSQGEGTAMQAVEQEGDAQNEIAMREAEAASYKTQCVRIQPCIAILNVIHRVLYTLCRLCIGQM